MAKEHVQRRLAAILAADVVGYSRSMQRDETGTLKRLKFLRSDVFDPRVEQFGGRIFKTTGDGALAEFRSTVDAAQCAVEIQQALALQNAKLPADSKISLRIGIGLGDVIVEGDDLYGNGVNISARMESLAEPGGICVAGNVHEHIGTALEVSFEDLGEQKVKNIDRPIRCYRAVLDRPAENSLPETTAAILRRPAVAVLPFANMSGDREQEYFADGLTEDIITALSHWRSFPVIARNSTFTYKNKSVDIKQASRALDARYLLEGSVRKGGRRIRITAQLIDGDTGHHIWAERYDRELDDIFDVQDEIAQNITAIVAPEIVKAEVKRSTAKRPDDLDAWDSCLRGMELIREQEPAATAKARELFQRAIAIQPDYSDAYAGLSLSYHLDILLHASGDRTATANMALEAAREAVRHDESSSLAHRALSTAYQWLDRQDDALREARISVRLNPNDADALHALGNKSNMAGDPNGVSYMRKAQRLNPQDAQGYSHLAFLARALVNIGADEEALDCARQAIEQQPDYPNSHFILAIALGNLGRKAEGKAALARCDKLQPGFVESRKTWQPYLDPESNERLQEGLRQLTC